ncbi:DedA family protein [Streptomyces bohaiensis]|uniref:DedA family protein n=1 Tax=Streptomyces bohaiensis TaxID=1431344 RepID=A0ABX1C6Y2_9ACTN|nr:DedA family protein [Streptomyces bohaiensis]
MSLPTTDPLTAAVASSVAPLTARAAEPTEVGGVAGFFVDLMEAIGGPGAGIAVAAENLFPPLPSELFLPLAGFTAGQGGMTLAEALIWTTLGSLVGAVALYWIGAAIGRDRLRAVVARMPLVKVADFDRTEQWFARHGTKAVFFGRMIPVFRSLISVPAGVERMPMPTFVLLTTAGSAVWNTALVLLGYSLGDNWHRVEGYTGVLEKLVLGAVAVAVLWFLVTRLRRRQRNHGEGEDEPRGRARRRGAHARR